MRVVLSSADIFLNLELFKLGRLYMCSLNLHENKFQTSLIIGLSSVIDRIGLSFVIDRIDELSISSEISSEGDAVVGVFELEILVAINDNLERDVQFETDSGEGFFYTAKFDALMGQFVETVRALRGRPRASTSIVDNFPLATLKKNEDSTEDDHVISISYSLKILVPIPVAPSHCLQEL
ncbi:hypothetical protein L2E82_33702 [Cichorium intybus]|uniref:Uncharacterized protein n=1 Tax=Cichorium intybus TaxID=13427 RepID=A0ACB9BKW8_CICIN|nr:hypothetical protein L2E82_33702 [Cichorium intybus]